MGDTAKTVRTKFATAIRSADGTSDQCREQKAAGIDAMVYIYRLKYPSFPPVRHFSFYLILSSPRIRFSFQCNHLPFSPAWRWKEREKRIVRLISRSWYFSRFSPFRRGSIRSTGRNKKRSASVCPSVRTRLSVHDCIREITIYGCRYCAAGYPLDIEGSERSSRENCSLRSGKPRVSGLPSSLSFSKAFVRAIGRYDKAWRRWWLPIRL